MKTEVKQEQTEKSSDVEVQFLFSPTGGSNRHSLDN